MKCLAYARVSTDKQAEKELSIPAQLSAMRQYAFDRGWQIVHEFSEAGVSARTADRPVLRQLLARCGEEGPTRIEVVLVHKLDRLARNLADHVGIRSQLRSRGVTIASVTEGLEDSVSGQLVEHILASMAEFYSANLSEEVKKGMRQKVLQGGWPHRLPRGYRLTRYVHHQQVEIDQVQGPLVHRAFEICATDYHGLVDLRWRLAAAGLRTPTGHPVSNGYLGRLLRNPFYCGQIRWNGDLYPGAHPPLVAPELFQQVQQVLGARTKRPRHVHSDLPLSGLAVCSKCGAQMGTDRHRRWTYYRCRRSFRAFDRCKSSYCNVDRVMQSLATILTPMRLASATVNQLIQLSAFDDERAKWLRLAGQQTRSAWDFFRILNTPTQRLLLALLFERLELDATGIVRFTRSAPSTAVAA